LKDLPKTDLPAPQLVMLANVALTAEVGGCEYLNEDKQMAELKTVGNSLSDSEVDEEEDNNDVDDDDEGMPEDESEPETPAEVQKTAGSDKDSLTTSTKSCYSVIDLRGKEIFGCFDDKSKRSKPFRCKPCQFEADSEEEFVHHIAVHSAKNLIVKENAVKPAHSKDPEENSEDGENCKGPIRCDRCGYNTNRYDHYLAHLRHHNKTGHDQQVFRCTICSYTTVSEYHWKKHLRNHFPKKVYTCCQCSYFSDRKNNYIQHIRTHTGERPYRCVHCPYSSSQKTHLTRHMRTHSGEKPFKCDQCSYVASNQHEVTRHARQVHNGPKPLNCPHCEYKTADRSNYKKHVELHVNPRQFLCPVCDYAASKKCNLQYHIKSRHHGCNDITMDVSKVRLRTKKAEAENLFGGDLEEAKDWQANSEEDQETHTSMETEKEEKKEEVQRKNPASSSTRNQITTRSHKLSKENSKARHKGQNTSEKKKEKSEKLVVGSEKLAGKSEKRVIKSEKPLEKSEKIAEKSKRLARKSEKLVEKSEKITEKSKRNSSEGKTIEKAETNEHMADDSHDLTQIQNQLIAETKLTIIHKGNKTSEGEASVLDVELIEVHRYKVAENTSEHKNIVEPAEDHRFEEAKTTEESEDEPKEAVESQCSDKQDESHKEMVVESQCSDKQDESHKEMAVESQCSDKQDESHKEMAVESQCSDKQDESHKEIALEPNGVAIENDSKTADPLKIPKVALELPSVNGKAPVESMDMEEDEGIHSHDGSDISDSVSEGSDDSGLNSGVGSASEVTVAKANPEETRQAQESYVCIFCDRMFAVEGEYRRHLNRHLVNVYYLETAAEEEDK
ncbi:RESTA factor, partial [Polyodon spathula]|nr:RESTA factor [Polyodon spathula]